MENTNTSGSEPVPAPPTKEEATESADLMSTALNRIDGLTADLMGIKFTIRSNLSRALSGIPLGHAADLISLTKIGIESLEEELKQMKESLNYCLEVTIPERFKAEEIKTFNTEKFRVTRTSRVFASIIPDTLPDAYDWLRENEYGAIIKETVNASTLSATAKELMENGQELPEDLFRVHMKDGTSITKKR